MHPDSGLLYSLLRSTLFCMAEKKLLYPVLISKVQEKRAEKNLTGTLERQFEKAVRSTKEILMDIHVTRDYLEIGGKPVFIFGGDLSYCRIHRRSWRERMQLMKAAGLNTVTVYIVWEYHQPSADVFDFTGERDLAHFLSLVKECGLYCIFRMGPFVHGEYRNGGLPQWLIDKVGARVRTNDPEYLHYAEAWYLELIRIVKPFQITRDGPVILLQLENELGSAGCKGDDLPRGSANTEENRKHLLFYYDLIRRNGIDLPLLDINHIPDKETLISPLVDTGGMYPVNSFYCDGDVQDYSTDWWQRHRHPLITIETGGGMFLRYYDTPPYRNTNGVQGPVVKPEIVEMSVNKHLAEGASGINLYIFCDGQNPDGCGENMLPVRNMNYQAPVTAVGRVRDSYWKLKRIGWFLRSFGEELMKSSPNADFAAAKACGIAHPGTRNGGDLFENYGKVRMEEESGSEKIPSLGRVTAGLNLSESNFLFLRNIFNTGSEWKRDVRVLTSPAGLSCEVWQEYPKRTQLDLAPGTAKIMPFFMRLRKGHFLEYSTAELLDRREFNGKTQLILCEASDIMTETRLTLPAGQDFRTAGNVLLLRESPNSVTMIARPERRPIVAESDELRVLLVSKTYGEHLWDIGTETAWSNTAMLAGNRSEVLCTTEQSDFAMEWLTPYPPEFGSGLDHPHEEYDAVRGIYRLTGTFDFPEREIQWEHTIEGDDLILTAQITEDLLAGLDDLVITARVDGSLANAYLDGKLVSDHAWGKFLPWEISVRDLPVHHGTLKLVCHDALDCRLSASPRMKYPLYFRHDGK